MSDNQIRVEPAELVTAAAELDKIADRLESTLVGARDALPGSGPELR